MNIKIKTKSKEYADSVVKQLSRSDAPNGISEIKQMIANGFVAGVRWHKSNQWIPAKEGFARPKDCMPILIRRYYRDKYGQFVTRVTQELFFEEFGFSSFCNKHRNERITHWMPIPQLS